MNRVLVISGQPGQGKTALCLRLLAELRTAGKRCGGVLSLALLQDDQPAGKMALDIASGEKRLLAVYRRQGIEGRYFPVDEGIVWGAAKIEAALAEADVLFIDEIGPWELSKGVGWRQVLDKALSADMALVVTVRPSLRETLLELAAGLTFSLTVDPECSAEQLTAALCFLEGS